MQVRQKAELLAGAGLIAAAVVVARTMRRSHATGPMATDETRRVRDMYEREAARYDSLIRIPERLLFSDGRVWATSQAVGDVLEIAVGTGRNLPYYAADLQVAGQDISPAMLEIARVRAEALGRPVDLHVGDAQALAFPSGRFDSVISTLALCTIPDDRRALAEVWRVLRPGGRLILLEHVRRPQRVVELLQRLLEPLAIRYAGDHLRRDPMDHLANLGFSVEYRARSRAGIVERLVARKIHQDASFTTGGHHDA